MSTNAAVPPTSRRPVVTVSRLVERLLGGSRDAAGRPKDSIEEAEEAGLVFAFRAHCLAILIVAVALVAIVSWPRDLYYLAFVAAFFVSGYVPFRLRRHPCAELVKLGFVVLDVALIAAAILNFPASNLSIGGYLPAMPGPAHAFFVARCYRTPGQSKGRSASRASRPIVVPFGRPWRASRRSGVVTGVKRAVSHRNSSRLAFSRSADRKTRPPSGYHSCSATLCK
jgi:hypothetical protein